MEFQAGFWNLQERDGEGWNTLLATPEYSDIADWLIQPERKPDEYRIVDNNGIERRRFLVVPEDDS